jgi:hypothetical protein
MPAPPLHHTHRSELIRHIRSESEESRFLEYLQKRELILNSGNDDEKKQNEDIEKIERYSCHEVHVGIQIGWYILLKGRKYHIPYHDTVEYEKSEKSRDVGEDICEHSIG